MYSTWCLQYKPVVLDKIEIILCGSKNHRAAVLTGNFFKQNTSYLKMWLLLCYKKIKKCMTQPHHMLRACVLCFWCQFVWSLMPWKTLNSIELKGNCKDEVSLFDLTLYMPFKKFFNIFFFIEYVLPDCLIK